MREFLSIYWAVLIFSLMHIDLKLMAKRNMGGSWLVGGAYGAILFFIEINLFEKLKLPRWRQHAFSMTIFFTVIVLAAWCARMLLQHYFKEQEDTPDDIVKSFKEGAADIRRYAIDELIELHQFTHEHFELLLTALDDPDAKVRQHFLESLNVLSPQLNETEKQGLHEALSKAKEIETIESIKKQIDEALKMVGVG